VDHSHQSLQKLQALFVSRKVLDWLKSGIIKGHIIGIYNNSFNIKTYDDIIINIGNDLVHLTPKSLLVSAQDFDNIILPRIQLRTFILGFNMVLFIRRANLCISVKEAIEYNPKLLLSKKILRSFIIKTNLLEAHKILNSNKHKMVNLSSSPLSGYFFSRLSFIENPDLKRVERRDDLFQSKAKLEICLKKLLWERIDYLLFSIKKNNWQDVSSAIRSILGMGPGLTPSGDDFLAGFISAGVVLGRVLSNINDMVTKISRSITEESQGMTTCISISMLEDAANGEMSEPFMKFMKSVLLTNNLEQIALFTKELGSIGATSGEDLYNGIATGIWFFKMRSSSLHWQN